MTKGFLAKEILDASWGTLKRYLDYKSLEEGSIYVEVDKNKTSQECYGCHKIVKKSLDERMHVCDCGYVDKRDVCASKIIEQRALSKIGLIPIYLPREPREVKLVENETSALSQDKVSIVRRSEKPRPKSERIRAW